MPASEWATTEQTKLLHEFLEPYIKAKGNQEEVPLMRFWNRLENAFFTKFPAEDVLKRPAPVEGVPRPPLTPEEESLVGASTALTQEAWMRYRERRRNRQTVSTQFGRSKTLFKRLAKRPSRPLRPVELYQRTRHAKIKAAVMLCGYNALTDNNEAPAGTTSAVEESVDRKKKQARVLRAARMLLWQTTARQLFSQEANEVKAEMERLTQEENVKCGMGAPPGEEDAMSPEGLQFAIVQIGAVFAKVHDMTLTQTGWMGFTMLGGPMPRRKGEISIKTICFGQSANGNDFATALPGFDTSIKVPFGQWLKQVFSHDVRDARMLTTIDGEEISMDAETDIESDNEEMMPKLPDGLLSMAPLVEASTLGLPPTVNASTSVEAPVGTPVGTVMTPQLRLRLPEVMMPDSPFDGLGDLMTANDFGQFDYDTALNEVLSHGSVSTPASPAFPVPVVPVVPATLTTPLASSSDATPPSGPFPTEDVPRFVFGINSSTSSLENSSSSTTPPPPSTGDVSRFVFDTKPPTSLPFSLGNLSSSTTHAPSASALASPSADHQALPAVPNATLTNVVPALARPKPKPLRSSALQRFNTALAATAHGSVAMASTSVTPTAPAVATLITPRSALSVGATMPAPAIPATTASSTVSLPPVTTTAVAPSARVEVGALPAAATTATTVSDARSPDPVLLAVAHVAGPQYVQSRPMANAPPGHALMPVPPAPKKRERPRKTAVPDVVENDSGGPEPQQAMSAAARAESARINKVAAALRKDTAEQLRLSREMEEAAARSEACSDVGISVIVRPVKGRCRELRSGERMGGSFDHNAAQEQADAEMGEQLRGGKRKAKAAQSTASKAPARKRARA
ncbi:hypothetical protein B0H14DRAFT_3508259 [Mycena olivaceomarginata]|nr:hypothetical protein B0H14DRAFT_3508259 [Mycena olivaceomarginata]